MRQGRDEQHITTEHDEASLWPAASAREVTTSRGKKLPFAAFGGVIFRLPKLLDFIRPGIGIRGVLCTDINLTIVEH